MPIWFRRCRVRDGSGSGPAMSSGELISMPMARRWGRPRASAPPCEDDGSNCVQRLVEFGKRQMGLARAGAARQRAKEGLEEVLLTTARQGLPESAERPPGFGVRQRASLHAPIGRDTCPHGLGQRNTDWAPSYA